MGTYVMYKLTTSTDVSWFENGVLQSEEDVEVEVDDNCYSQYYNDYSIAVQYYHYYRNYNIDYSCDYRVINVKMNVFDEERTFTVPFEYPNLVV